MKTPRWLAGWMALALAGMACGPGAAARGEAGVLEINADGTARAVGVVIENDRGCEVDAVCRLVVDAGGRRIAVVYHEGEAVPCVNREAVRRGLALSSGDRVEAYGAYAGGGPTISTCPSESYYLRLVAE